MNKKTVLPTILLLLLLLLSSCSLSQLSYSKVTIFGVALDYKDQGRDLNGTINDVMETVSCLKDIYQSKRLQVETHYMIQKGSVIDSSSPDYPTAEHVLNKLKTFNPKKNELFIFIYAGHGKDTGEFILGKNKATATTTTASMNSVFDIINSYGCNSIAIIDCCYSGKMAENNSSVTYDFDKAFKTMFQKKKYNSLCVIAAAEPTEKSYESAVYADHYHGYFTQALLESLGWNHYAGSRNIKTGSNIIEVLGSLSAKKTGTVTTASLFSQIDEKVRALTSFQNSCINMTLLDTVLIP